MAEKNTISLPIEINITKIVVFLSAIFFVIGIYLIFSTLSEFLYLYNGGSFSALLNIGKSSDFLILGVFLLVLLFFPSNDTFNLATVMKKRVQNYTGRFLILLFRIETIFVISLLLIYLGKHVDTQSVLALLLLLFIISLLLQTPYSVIQKIVNPIQAIKLQILNTIDDYTSSGRNLSIITGSFLSQLYPSPENLFILILLVFTSSTFEGLLLSVITGVLSTVLLFVYWGKMSSRGNYFRRYVNFLLSALLIYLVGSNYLL